jgi:hypothetical protein
MAMPEHIGDGLKRMAVLEHSSCEAIVGFHIKLTKSF